MMRRISLALVAMLLTAGALVSQMQPMRIGGGSYVLQGEVARLPASCVRVDLKVPRLGTSYLGATKDITVSRIVDGRVVETKPITEVLGKWFDVQGADSTHDLIVKVIDKSATYNINVPDGGSIFAQ